jgi:hypothetical protein
MASSQILYKEELGRILTEQTGIKLDQPIQTCINSQNDTVQACPINLKENRDLNEFIVIVHNQANKANKQYSRIRLPSKDYTAKLWKGGAFVDVPQDIFEQAHFGNKFEQFSDWELNVYADFEPGEVAFLKLEKTENENASKAQLQRGPSQNTKLDIQGFNAKGEVIFRYSNRA